MKKLFSVGILVLVLLGCGKNYPIKNVAQKNAFYFWKTNWDLSKQSLSLLDSLDVQVYYLKFFDVDWDDKNKEVIPIGRNNISNYSDNLSKGIEIIPTIFISNNVLKNLTMEQLPGLAHNIYRKTRLQFNNFYQSAEITHSVPEEASYGEGPYHMTYQNLTFPEEDTTKSIHQAFDNLKEIQIDCDWTESTRDKYFEFLKLIKKQFKNKLVSCTIRMYPYKYPTKAGVPPVDKGMLMLYNVGDVSKIESGNSIFDKNEVMKYLNGNEKYPLILDYAFPIFEWISVYHNNKIIKLLSITEVQFLDYDTRFTVDKKNNHAVKYTAKEKINFHDSGLILEKGDVLKYETINYWDVAEIAAKISSINTNPEPHISIFQFDFDNVRKHKNEIIKIYSKF